MKQHEHIGEFRLDGALTIHGDTKDTFVVGEKIRVILEPIPRRDKKTVRQLDPTTKRVLGAIDKSPDIGAPEIQNGFIPYGRQSIDEKDVAAVCSVLRSDWLTTGPKVQEFEQAIADYVGAKYATAVSSGTAALHAAMFALGIGPGDEVIVPPMTFAATANCVVYQGGTPVFADVDPDTLLLDPEQVEAKITPDTKAIIGVDYAGQPCDWDALRDIADRNNLHLVDDGCHALGAE